MGMETRFLLIAIASALIGHGIGWAFPPAQWIKHIIGIDRNAFTKALEDGNGSGGDWVKWLHFQSCKAANCPACMAFWSCSFLALAHPSWWHLASMTMAYIIAAIIDRHLSQQ
jgi:hypothetical protein